MDLQFLNPFVRYCRIHNNMGSFPQFHIAYDCRLFYLLSGEITLIINGEKMHLTKYSSILIPPGIPYHLSRESEETRMAIVNFDQVTTGDNYPSPLRIATESEFCRENILPAPMVTPLDRVVFCESAPAVKKRILSLADLFFKQDFCYAEDCSAILKQILLHILAANQAPQTKHSRLCQQISEYIAANAHLGISNETVAEKFGYHSYYLNSLLKTHTGMTLTQMIIDQKLKFAQDLILTSDIALQDVAIQCGFSDSAYFSRLFKKKTGFSPREFRKTAGDFY